MAYADVEYHATHTFGFNSVENYLDWCEKNSFSTSLRKKWPQLKKEKSFFDSERFDKTLRSCKKITPKKFIRQIRAGQIKSEPNFGQVYQEIYNIAKSENGNLFLDIASSLINTKLIDDVKYIRKIHSLLFYKSSWIRDYKTWKVKTHNPEKQFSSFVRHLLTKYDVPKFMDMAWWEFGQGVQDKLKTYRDWFIFLGQGGNIRKADNLHFPLSKKQAHHFLQAPNTFTIKNAFYWAQVRALNGDRNLVEALIPSKFSDIQDIGFRDSIIKFFVDNPMLDLYHVNPILDYIWEQKYQQRRTFIGRGEVRIESPPQPNFSMNGRTAETLLNQVERWHRQLGKERKSGALQWQHSKEISDYEFKEGNVENKTLRFWRIEELLSSGQLTAEGRFMGHCVASYAHSCANGNTSIWSLSIESFKLNSKLVTIEVRNKTVQQIRGKSNRLPTQKEYSYIKQWAKKNSLQISRYLRVN